VKEDKRKIRSGREEKGRKEGRAVEVEWKGRERTVDEGGK